MTNSIKTILAAVFLLFALMPARAQKHFQPNIAVGGKAGVTLSKVNFSPGVKQGWNMGKLPALLSAIWRKSTSD